jgi:bacillithiol biosynthesis cysteine-adding enzyme BshC
VRDVYPVDFRAAAGFCASAASRGYPEGRRAATVSLLRRQAERWGFLDASRASLDRLARPDALAVVAGQQPGLFGGPLYTVYKALTAIAVAAEAERATGRPVVPIFWIAADDHDFEEVRRAYLSDGAAEPGVLEYPLDAVPRGASVARVPLGPPIEDLLRSLEQNLPPSEFRDESMARLRGAYAAGTSWADAFARLAGAWVVPFGALVFDPTDAEAKRLVLPVFEREIELAGRTSRAALERGADLESRGYHAQIARSGDELNLFWHGERREALRLAGNGTFRLAESGRSLARTELLSMVRERPEDASPGVLLRPLTQDYLFPTAAYVGGPSEVAYWAQVNALYPLFEMAPPAVVPRAGATILEPKIRKLLDRFGLEWGSLAGDPEVVIRETLKRLLPEDLPALLEAERAGWLRSFGRIESAVTAFDPSLKAAVKTATGKTLHEAENLERKLMHVWKRRHEEWVQQIRRARGHLFPHGALQERSISVLGYVARYGAGLFDELRRAVHEPGTHVLVPLGG